MLEEQKEFVFSNKHLIDSNALLSNYLTRAKAIRNSFTNLKLSIENCDEYIYQVGEYAADLVNAKNNDFEQRAGKDLIKAINEDQKLLNEIDETVEILKQLHSNIKSLKKLIWQLKLQVYFYRARKVLINTIFILFIAFVLNYLLDFSQSFVEFSFEVSHFHLLFFSFFFQVFLIDPLVIKRLSDKFNWELINIMQDKLPEIEERIKNGKNEFNRQVSKYRELCLFIVD
jgi:hypothetical protein